MDNLKFGNDKTQNTSALKSHENRVGYIDGDNSNRNINIEVKQENVTKSEICLRDNPGTF